MRGRVGGVRVGAFEGIVRSGTPVPAGFGSLICGVVLRDDRDLSLRWVVPRGGLPHGWSFDPRL